MLEAILIIIKYALLTMLLLSVNREYNKRFEELQWSVDMLLNRIEELEEELEEKHKGDI